MESYFYFTEDGKTGYFQIVDRLCFSLPFEQPIMRITRGQWAQYFCLDQIDQIDQNTISFQLNEAKWYQAASYFVKAGHYEHPIKVIRLEHTKQTGKYFKRINRGELKLSEQLINTPEALDEKRAYENITESLNAIFRTIEPDVRNLNTYGNQIRELLIIACTEVEYLLQKLLKDNDILPKNSFYTTNDYARCLSILKLNEYEVNTPYFPALGIFSPFSKWNISTPTKSLDWYYSYNQVKHDRGGTKDKANLGSLINSIAALHIILEAQYGSEIFNDHIGRKYKTEFKTVKKPTWEITEICIPSLFENEIKWEGTMSYADFI